MLNFLKRLFSKTTQTQPTGHIVAAKIQKIEEHPNADRLKIVTLNIGNILIYPVVCGAINLQEGNVVALALPGATIAHNIHSDGHESFVLDKAKIRGIESQGMICAEFELGLSSEIGEKPEIMILPPDIQLGKILF